MRLVIAVLAAIMATAQPGLSRPAVDAVDGRPPVAESADRRCTADGLSCIHLSSYVPDVCRTIERAASRQGLDKDFLARLLWKESLFEPGAVSHAGAEGIAQFIPSTAAIVGLHDPFNPAEAIHVSASYLKRLENWLGNLGLAAVAYNGGENRAAAFLREGGQLPYETQDYVEAITGYNAWRWRENPPAPDELSLALDAEKPFLEACVTLAGNRSLREFATDATRNPVSPWGVILGSHPTRNGVQAQINRMNRSLGALLGGNRVTYVRRTLRPGGPRVYTAQVGWGSRGEASAFCGRARSVGVTCMVLRN